MIIIPGCVNLNQKIVSVFKHIYSEKSNYTKMFVNHEIRQIWVLNTSEEVKPGFLLSLMCLFPETNETKF